MSDYSTAEVRLQVVNIPDSTGADREYHVDLNTGEMVEPLDDPKFGWREKKIKGLVLADAYKDGGDGKRAERSVICSTWLQYYADADGGRRELHRFNACQQRLCPLCSARRAKIAARRLARVLARVRADHAGTQLIFLTLTIQNVPGAGLRAALDQLTGAWKKMIDRRPVKRAIRGWFRAIEITRNAAADTYHPHIHAILVVEDAYFVKSNGLYLTKDNWIDMWQQSLRVQYRPSVNIKSTYVKAGAGPKSGKAADAAQAAAVEAAKYATKDADYISPGLSKAKRAEIVKIYTEALAGKRLTGMGGWVKEAAAALKLEIEADKDDLVHDDEGSGELTEESAELLEEYGWHFGLMEHYLTARKANPNYRGGSGGDSGRDGSDGGGDDGGVLLEMPERDGRDGSDGEGRDHGSGSVRGLREDRALRDPVSGAYIAAAMAADSS